MSVREGDLTKMADLVALLDDWRAAAAAIGLELKSVTVAPGQYVNNNVWYNDGTSEPPFWQVD
jgi:hypothetical protein